MALKVLGRLFNTRGGNGRDNVVKERGWTLGGLPPGFKAGLSINHSFILPGNLSFLLKTVNNVQERGSSLGLYPRSVRKGE